MLKINNNNQHNKRMSKHHKEQNNNKNNKMKLNKRLQMTKIMIKMINKIKIKILICEIYKLSKFLNEFIYRLKDIIKSY